MRRMVAEAVAQALADAAARREREREAERLAQQLGGARRPLKGLRDAPKLAKRKT